MNDMVEMEKEYLTSVLIGKPVPKIFDAITNWRKKTLYEIVLFELFVRILLSLVFVYIIGDSAEFVLAVSTIEFMIGLFFQNRIHTLAKYLVYIAAIRPTSGILLYGYLTGFHHSYFIFFSLAVLLSPDNPKSIRLSSFISGAAIFLSLFWYDYGLTDMVKGKEFGSDVVRIFTIITTALDTSFYLYFYSNKEIWFYRDTIKLIRVCNRKERAFIRVICRQHRSSLNGVIPSIRAIVKRCEEVEDNVKLTSEIFFSSIENEGDLYEKHLEAVKSLRSMLFCSAMIKRTVQNLTHCFRFWGVKESNLDLIFHSLSFLQKVEYHHLGIFGHFDSTRYRSTNGNVFRKGNLDSSTWDLVEKPDELYFKVKKERYFQVTDSLLYHFLCKERFFKIEKDMSFVRKKDDGSFHLIFTLWVYAREVLKDVRNLSFSHAKNLRFVKKRHKKVKDFLEPDGGFSMISSAEKLAGTIKGVIEVEEREGGQSDSGLIFKPSETVIRFCLPLKVVEKSERKQALMKIEEEERKNLGKVPKLNVLVIEDKFVERFVIMRECRDNLGIGSNVVGALDGVDGLKKYEVGDFDCCFIGYEMEGENGVELARKIRDLDSKRSDRKKRVKLVLVSEKMVIQKMKNDCIDQILTKPVGRKEFSKIFDEFVKKAKSVRRKQISKIFDEYLEKVKESPLGHPKSKAEQQDSPKRKREEEEEWLIEEDLPDTPETPVVVIEEEQKEDNYPPNANDEMFLIEDLYVEGVAPLVTMITAPGIYPGLTWENIKMWFNKLSYKKLTDTLKELSTKTFQIFNFTRILICAIIYSTCLVPLSLEISLFLLPLMIIISQMTFRIGDLVSGYFQHHFFPQKCFDSHLKQKSEEMIEKLLNVRTAIILQEFFLGHHYFFRCLLFVLCPLLLVIHSSIFCPSKSYHKRPEFLESILSDRRHLYTLTIIMSYVFLEVAKFEGIISQYFIRNHLDPFSGEEEYLNYAKKYSKCQDVSLVFMFFELVGMRMVERFTRRKEAHVEVIEKLEGIRRTQEQIITRLSSLFSNPLRSMSRTLKNMEVVRNRKEDIMKMKNIWVDKMFEKRKGRMKKKKDKRIQTILRKKAVEPISNEEEEELRILRQPEVEDPAEDNEIKLELEQTFFQKTDGYKNRSESLDEYLLRLFETESIDPFEILKKVGVQYSDEKEQQSQEEEIESEEDEGEEDSDEEEEEAIIDNHKNKNNDTITYVDVFKMIKKSVSDLMLLNLNFSFLYKSSIGVLVRKQRQMRKYLEQEEKRIGFKEIIENRKKKDAKKKEVKDELGNIYDQKFESFMVNEMSPSSKMNGMTETTTINTDSSFTSLSALSVSYTKSNNQFSKLVVKEAENIMNIGIKYIFISHLVHDVVRSERSSLEKNIEFKVKFFIDGMPLETYPITNTKSFGEEYVGLSNSVITSCFNSSRSMSPPSSVIRDNSFRLEAGSNSEKVIQYLEEKRKNKEDMFEIVRKQMVIKRCLMGINDKNEIFLRHCFCDEKFYLLFRNLISNAVAGCYCDGCTVSINVIYFTSMKQVSISIHDDGEGIEKEKLERIREVIRSSSGWTNHIGMEKNDKNRNNSLMIQPEWFMGNEKHNNSRQTEEKVLFFEDMNKKWSKDLEKFRIYSHLYEETMGVNKFRSRVDRIKKKKRKRKIKMMMKKKKKKEEEVRKRMRKKEIVRDDEFFKLGIGFVVCSRIVKSMGGIMEVFSGQSYEGTDVRVTIPCSFEVRKWDMK